MQGYASSDVHHPEFILKRMTHLHREVASILNEFGKGDVFAFDIDNTVYRENQMLGTDDWYSNERKHLICLGLSREAADEKLRPLNLKIKSVSEYRLMDESIPHLIRGLQDKGVIVIGMTARHPDLARATHINLLRHEVDFRRSAIDPRLLKGFESSQRRRFLYENGVFYLDGANKGKILGEIFQAVRLRPQRLGVIDDRIEHVESYIELLQEMGITGRLYHYLAHEEGLVFNPAVSDVQRIFFEREGKLVSDLEALKFLIDHQLIACEQILEEDI